MTTSAEPTNKRSKRTIKGRKVLRMANTFTAPVNLMQKKSLASSEGIAPEQNETEKNETKGMPQLLKSDKGKSRNRVTKRDNQYAEHTKEIQKCTTTMKRDTEHTKEIEDVVIV